MNQLIQKDNKVVKISNVSKFAEIHNMETDKKDFEHDLLMHETVNFNYSIKLYCSAHEVLLFLCM